jgi:hypothetical protein
MSDRNSSIQYYAGSGKPRLIALKSAVYESTIGTVYTDTTVQEDEDVEIAILTSSADDPSLITTQEPNGFQQGDWVRISGHTGSTPDVNGIYQVLETPGTDSFKIAVHVTAGGTGGLVRKTPAYVQRGLFPNQRIVVDMAERVTYAKILSIDTGNDSAPSIIIDAWNNGIPSDGSKFIIDGFIADLPRCAELTEMHSPYSLTHHLYRGRKNSKQFGWSYRCALDYSKYLSADTILALMEQLNIGPDDTLILIPRSDAPEYQYNVFYKDDINVSMFGLSPGYRKIVLSFEATELQCFPKPYIGYGAGYGWSYGEQL